jgi:predicted RNA-binding protein YlxR (DUF448 family)
MGCHKRGEKTAMVRLIMYEGMIKLDDAGSAPGRGGYLHPETNCIDKFIASKVKEFRSLKSRIERAERIRIAQAIKRRLDSEMRLE